MTTLELAQLLSRFDPATGALEGRPVIERRLSDLRAVFSDPRAFEGALEVGDPLVYVVSSFEPGDGEGDPHYGLGVVQPGTVGQEFFMTRGHLHAWRPASELYIGLEGRGLMLLEPETGGPTSTVPLEPNTIVYVPGYTAHRTVNTGSVRSTRRANFTDHRGRRRHRFGHRSGLCAGRGGTRTAGPCWNKPRNARG